MICRLSRSCTRVYRNVQNVYYNFLYFYIVQCIHALLSGAFMNEKTTVVDGGPICFQPGGELKARLDAFIKRERQSGAYPKPNRSSVIRMALGIFLDKAELVEGEV